MSLEVDHVFICVDPEAPEAEFLISCGFAEGPRNTHPGQGTANRRFFFRNCMLELLWVSKPSEAQSIQTAPTKLWERWTSRRTGACPFGVILTQSADGPTEPPFPSTLYQPDWAPKDFPIHLGAAGIEEPLWVFMPLLKRSRMIDQSPVHPNGASDITGIRFTTPVPWNSESARAAASIGIQLRQGPRYEMELEFDHNRRQRSEIFAPELPLTVCW